MLKRIRKYGCISLKRDRNLTKLRAFYLFFESKRTCHLFLRHRCSLITINFLKKGIKLYLEKQNINLKISFKINYLENTKIK